MTQEPITTHLEDGLFIARMTARHGNALNEDLLGAIMDVFGHAAEDPEVRGVLFASGGKIFSPGLDLQELLALDREAMESFMDLFSNCLLSLYTFPKPMVAAISGHAVAGGCVLTLTADRRILKQGAIIGLNEVKVGVPLPYSVALLLREMVHRPSLPEIALLGRNFQDQEAVDAGLAHEIHLEEGFEPYCLQRLEEYASRDLAAFSTTKRYLRATALERMRVGDTPHRRQFLDCWFSKATRQRIETIVASLKKPNEKEGRAHG